MGKVVGTVLKVVGIVALTVVTGGAAGIAALSTLAAGTALGSAILIAGSLALSVGSGLLAKDKAQKAAASARAEQIRALVNPQARANWVFGETATAVQIVYSEVMGSKKDTAALIYAGPCHPLDSYGQLYINDDAVSFSGNDATGSWAGAVSRYTNLGSESQAALVIPGSTWPSTARGRGFAHFGLKWFLGKDKLKDGLPDRLTQVVKGSPVYDPRLDNTVGGSGTQRANDQTTWAYSNSVSADAGANWSLVCLHYILGWKNNGKLVYGRGADALDIDYASFITAANVCDALVDGIPRYHIGGIERIDGDHARVIGALEATIGGKISKSGGMYHCWAPNDDLVATETISENDLIRDAGVNFQDARSIQNIFTTGQGQFIDPSALYQPAPYPEVTEASAVTDLGRERIMNYDTPFLQDEKRVQRVILQQIRRSLYGRVWKLGVGPKFFRRKVFDVVTLNIKETNFTDTFARITEKTTSPNGLIIFTLEEENSLIYDVTAALGTLAARNIPPTFDAATNIPVTTLVLSAVSVTGTGGTASDALQVSYDDPGPLVNRTDIEYQVQGATNWQPAASKVLDAGVAIISPVESGTTYYVRVRHWTIFDVPSAWVTDFVTAGQAQVAGSIDFANVVGVTKPEDGADVTSTNQFTPSIAWNFDNSQQSWTTGQTTVVLLPTSIQLTSTGTDPTFASPTGLVIQGAASTLIRVRIKRTAGSGWDGHCFYETSGHGQSGSYSKVITDPTILNQWVIAEYDMANLTAGGTDWVDNTITRLRLDFGTTTSDVFEVDWIAVGRIGSLADVTADNKSFDTDRVNAVLAPVVEGNAQTGYDLTQFNGTVLDPSSFGLMDLTDLDPVRQGRIDIAINTAGDLKSGINADITTKELMQGIAGPNLSKNPEFFNGFDGYSVYDNSNSGFVTMTTIPDDVAPNTSGIALQISYDGLGSPTDPINPTPTPAYGGVFQSLSYAGNGNPIAPGLYVQNIKILYKVIAKIPVGRTLVQASNGTGTGGGFRWLTPTAGTGVWETYIGVRIIGSTGTFSSTGHLYIVGGTNIAFDWFIAKYDQIVLNSGPVQFVGTSFRDSLGNPLTDTAVLNSNTTPTDIGYTGALNANYVINTNQLSDGAGLGINALWSNIAGQTNAPASNADVTNYADDRVKNSGLQLNADGTMAYWNGTSWVSLGATDLVNLGYLGDLAATRQANQGAYAAATTYAKGDVITSGGSSYEYINATSGAGNAPPNATYWFLLAARGSPGDPGNKIRFAYIASATQPATPTGTTFPPAGWSAAPPGGSSSIWVVQVEYTGVDVYVGPWSTPAQFANPGTTARSGVISLGLPTTISATAYVQLGSIISLDLGPDGSHTVNYSLHFSSTTGGPTTVFAKIQWRPVGGTWADLTIEKSNTSNSNVEPAFLSDSLVNNFSGTQTSYEFRVLVKHVGDPANLTNASGKATWTNA